MSADKFLKLQTDVRHNQEDLQSFLRDLNCWESNIKKKDQELTKDDSASSERKLPPVRNRKVETKKKRKKKKQTDDGTIPPTSNSKMSPDESTSSDQAKKIRAYDYRSWDQFDVDAACAAVDGSDDDAGRRTAEKEEDEYETDSDAEREEMEIQRRIMEANAEKDKGNAFFKRGRYEEAMGCYSKGLEADSNNALLSANRAMALLKLKRYDEAEKDCDKAISLDYTYVKAYARRGTARFELGKLEEAKKDFEQVLNIEADNKQAKNEIKKIERLLKEREEERRRAKEPSNIVHAVHKLPHLRSKKPLKRMTIQEVGKGVAEERQREKERLMALKERKMREIDSDSRTAAATPSEEARIQEVKSRTGAVVSENTEDNKESPTQQETESQRKRGNSPRQKGKSPSALPAKPASPGVPSSSFQLQADWKRLRGHSDVLFEYFKKIPPASYPKLFQNSLDSAMLTQVLSVLKDSYIPSCTPIFETLEKLSTVKRFDMNVMFMSSKEKQVVRELFAHLTSENVDGESCRQLAKKYGL